LQESQEANSVLQTERDYTLTNSIGKVTTRADDIAEAKKKGFAKNGRFDLVLDI